MRVPVNSTNVDSLTSLEAPASRPPLCAPPWSSAWLPKLVRQYNRVRRIFVNPVPTATGFPELCQVRTLASTFADIDEHLELIFVEALLCQPKVIVELGVRTGTSTLVFERAASLCGASLISVDLEDCSAVLSSPQWHFFQGDDVCFAGVFPEFCNQRRIRPSVDLLFIDTSHYYEHTVREINAWFPLLSQRAKVMFHDTNLKEVGVRKDGCFQLSWDNRRGVIRAIEEYLGIQIDETRQCTEFAAGWLVRHWPNCNGFTILDRIA